VNNFRGCKRAPGWVHGRQLTAGERDEARHLLQVLFENSRVARNAIEPQTGMLGLSVGQWRSQWAAMRRDLDAFTAQVSKGHRMDDDRPAPDGRSTDARLQRWVRDNVPDVTIREDSGEPVYMTGGEVYLLLLAAVDRFYWHGADDVSGRGV
jgi:hypothetical protein